MYTNFIIDASIAGAFLLNMGLYVVPTLKSTCTTYKCMTTDKQVEVDKGANKISFLNEEGTLIRKTDKVDMREISTFLKIN